MPALLKAKELARVLMCSKNLSNYGLAVNMYLDDNDGYFPGAHQWLHANPWSWANQPISCQWHNKSLKPDGSLWPYVENREMHLCPTFKALTRHKGCPNPSHDPSIPIEPQYSYSQNGWCGDDDFSVAGIQKIDQIRRSPALIFIYAEENMWKIPGLSGAVLNDNGLYITHPEFQPWYPRDAFATYHKAPGGDLNKGGANVVYLDGHCGFVRVTLENRLWGFYYAWPGKWRYSLEE